MRESKPEFEVKKGTVAIFRGLDCQLARPRQGSRTTSGRLEIATCPVERRPGAKIERSETRTCRLLLRVV